VAVTTTVDVMSMVEVVVTETCAGWMDRQLQAADCWAESKVDVNVNSCVDLFSFAGFPGVCIGVGVTVVVVNIVLVAAAW